MPQPSDSGGTADSTTQARGAGSRLDLTAEEVWECYQRLGSLRAVGKEVGVGHMTVSKILARAGFPVARRDSSGEALNPRDKFYVAPSRIELTDMLAKQEGRTRNEMARVLYDEALIARGVLEPTEPTQGHDQS